MQNNNFSVFKLLPILLCFGVMGFIDIIGVATSYVKQQYELSDTITNLLPSMALIWFVFISLPIGMLMGSIGRKRTILLSLIIMAAAMMLSLMGNSFGIVLISFALLGFGNTIMQVAINPLLQNVVPSEKITSAITFGQFIKAIISFIGPILIGIAATHFGNWRLVFVVYAATTLLAFLWLSLTPIPKEEYEQKKTDSAAKIFALLKDGYLLACFSIIVCQVGFEISLMTAVPKYLAECCGLPLNEGALGCSLFYATKILAAFVGAIILARVSSRKYMIISLIVSLVSFAVFMGIGNVWSIMISLGVVGFATANIFAIALSIGMQHKPEYANKISALMIMGVAGGAIFPPIVGLVADGSNQQLSLIVLLIILAYILFASVKWLKK